MAREIGVKMTLDARQTVDETARVDAAMEGLKEELSSVDRAIKETEKDAAEMGAALAVAKAETKGFGTQTRSTQADVKGLDDRIKDAKANVGQMALAFDEASTRVNRKNLDNARSTLSTLERTKADLVAWAKSDPANGLAAEAAAGVASATETGMLDGFKQGYAAMGSPGWIPIAIGAGVVLSPVLATIVSGAVVGAAGLGGIAGGIFAARNDPGVREALSQFGADMSQKVETPLALAFRGPIEQGLSILSQKLSDSHIADVFAKAAPFVTSVASGIGDLVKNLMPGLSILFDKAGPVMDAFSAGLGATGSALGTFFDEVATGPGTAQGLADAFQVLNTSIVDLGGVLHYLSDANELITKLGNLGSVNGQGGGFSGGVQKFLGTAFPPFQLFQAAYSSARTLQNQDSGYGQTTALFARVPQANDVVVKSQSDLARETTMVGDAFGYEERQGQIMQDGLNALTKAYDDNTNAALGAWDATIKLAQAELDAQKAIDNHTLGWELNTQAGVDNEKTIYKAIDAAVKQRDQLIQNSDGSQAAIDQINSAYDTEIQKLVDLAKQMGATQDEADALAQTYTITFDVVYNPNGVGMPLDQLANFHGSKHAGGGYDPGGHPYLAGEAGPELIWPAGPTYVSTAGQTRQWMGSASPSGGAHVTVSAAPGADSALLSGVMQYLRFTVDKQYGGSAQAAFSRRGI